MNSGKENNNGDDDGDDEDDEDDIDMDEDTEDNTGRKNGGLFTFKRSELKGLLHSACTTAIKHYHRKEFKGGAGRRKRGIDPVKLEQASDNPWERRQFIVSTFEMQQCYLC